MSIVIYAFLRIIFSVLACPLGRALSDILPALQHPPPSRSTRRGLSGIECRPVQRVQRPGVCALHLARPVLLSVVCSPPGCAGGWVSTGGAYSRRPAPPGQSLNHRKNKKGSKITLPSLPISKISRKNKKTPTKGLCSALYFPYKP